MPPPSAGRPFLPRAIDGAAVTLQSSPENPQPAPQGAGQPARLTLPAWVADTAVCLSLALLGLWFVIMAGQLPTGRGLIGVGTFPMALGLLLIGLCLWQIILSWSTRRRGLVSVIERPLVVATGVVLILIFPTAMDQFGYYLTCAIWVPAFAWIAGIREPLTFVAITAGLLAMARFVFDGLLGTPLS